MSRVRHHGSHSSASGFVWIAAMAFLAISIAAGWFYLKRESNAGKTNKETGCLESGTVPQAALFMVDATDRLSPVIAKRVVDKIRTQAEQLPDHSRIIVIPFGGDTATPLQPILSKCLPNRKARLDQNNRLIEQAYADFLGSLEQLSDKLQSLEDSKTSPITSQVVRAASDSDILHWNGDVKTMVLLTDGLESSIYWTRDLQLKPPPKGILEGVQAEYFELGNARAGRLQTNDMREQWKAWLQSAGASVRMTAPGYRS